ncbi:MAG: propanediol utilization protein, partial [Firmicutes bacterium]|nr:propanediol utilization protein [Bacillota bacterium]
EVELEKGAIVALRHIHLSPAQAEEAGVKDKDVVSVKIEGERGLIFDNVLIRSGEAHEREIHLDTDEGNAAGLKNDVEVEILK